MVSPPSLVSPPGEFSTEQHVVVAFSGVQTHFDVKSPGPPANTPNNSEREPSVDSVVEQEPRIVESEPSVVGRMLAIPACYLTAISAVVSSSVDYSKDMIRLFSGFVREEIRRTVLTVGTMLSTTAKLLGSRD